MAENRYYGRGVGGERLLPPPGIGPTPPLPPSHMLFEPGTRGVTRPLLLRTFTKIGGHNPKEVFVVRGEEPKDVFEIYTWKDATLRELTDLIKEISDPEAKRKNAEFSFAFVYADEIGRFVVREVGKTFSYGTERQPDDGKTLAELGFEIGYHLDVAIHPVKEVEETCT